MLPLQVCYHTAHAPVTEQYVSVTKCCTVITEVFHFHQNRRIFLQCFFCTKSPCISKYKGRPKLLASVAKDNMILFPVSPCASEPTVHLSVAKTPSVSQRIWHPSVTWLSNCEQPNTFLSVWYHDLPDVPCTWLCYQILKHIQLTNQKVWKKKKKSDHLRYVYD